MPAKRGMNFPQRKPFWSSSVDFAMAGIPKGKFVFTLVFIVLTVASLCTGSIHTYGGDFNLAVPANPDETKGWMSDAIIVIPDHFIIVDIDVSVTITHSSDFDLQLYL
jgi:hypothetical protein